MQGTAISADTQALLLLCSRLGLASDVKPLALAEWNKVAAILTELGMRPGDLLGQSAAALSQRCRVNPTQADRMALLLERGGQLALELERLSTRGIWAISRADEEYPRRWKQRLKHAAPVVLFGVGRLPDPSRPAMAIVGSRDVDDEALAFTERLARTCALADVVVVSGGARGTDMAALAASVDAGGAAVAVLADSLEQTLRKRDLVNAVRTGRLTLLSSEHPSKPFSVSVAMGRNKLIYCLADWAAVISSAAESGGTWAGATEAIRHAWVPVFVRDGAGVPEGNQRLLEQGTSAISAADLQSWTTLQERLSAYGSVVAAPPLVRETPPLFGPEAEAAAEAQVMKSPPSEPTAPVDVYALVADALVAYCAAPRTADEVADAFSILLAQANVWLARAVKEKRLRKRTRPVRYEATADLFGAPSPR